jgi:5-hydroxyisourate hydrolase
MGRLTTHVLDLVRGGPAAGMAVELVTFDGTRRRPLASVVMNRDGRCDAPLLEGETFTAGVLQLEFQVAKYFKAQGVTLPDPPFLDVVVIRFAVSNAADHYHVPLLVTPWSYSTYRGS